MSYDFPLGEVLLISKPYEWTSFDVVNKIRCLIKHHLGIKKIKIGHAGTLDPLATGLLIICTGKLTKKIDEYQAFDKEYEGTFYLGATTPSYDMETDVDSEYEITHLTDELINNAAKSFLGTISQKPPIFSAAKIDGERAYEIARKGKDIEMKSREIRINKFDITRINLPEVDFRIECSKGTYIRSIAKSIGESLHCGAYLLRLCRIKIGNYSLEHAINLEDFEKKLKEEVFS